MFLEAAWNNMEAISKECGTERKMQTLLGEHKALLEETSCRQKLQWFGHVSSRQGTLMHTAMHGVAEGNRGRARPRLTWIHGISNWTNRSVIECVRKAEDRVLWRRRVESAKCPNGQQATGVT